MTFNHEVEGFSQLIPTFTALQILMECIKQHQEGTDGDDQPYDQRISAFTSVYSVYQTVYHWESEKKNKCPFIDKKKSYYR